MADLDAMAGEIDEPVSEGVTVAELAEKLGCGIGRARSRAEAKVLAGAWIRARGMRHKSNGAAYYPAVYQKA